MDDTPLADRLLRVGAANDQLMERMKKYVPELTAFVENEGTDFDAKTLLAARAGVACLLSLLHFQMAESHLPEVKP